MYALCIMLSWDRNGNLSKYRFNTGFLRQLTSEYEHKDGMLFIMPTRRTIIMHY